ncbi:ribonuclease E inhibitor RraA/Dimethylmenaquinone methyltransferase [Gorgonomyces haynaldii]|nr:ribonuclease E inhibitor RraA/Dimethylmenaquinone methyltransferase [Gorgonomyces haynaldii]
MKLWTKRTKIVGPAYTVEFVLKTDSQAPTTSTHHLDNAPKDSIVVIKAPKAPNAVWGGLMTARAKQLQVKGVVVEGRFRDLEELESMDFPVFAQGQSTMGAGMFVRVSAIQEPITLGQETGWPVTVRPGDLIVADVDGVVSVPQTLVQDVTELCEKLTAIDQKCMEDVQAGHTLQETFKKHR